MMTMMRLRRRQCLAGLLLVAMSAMASQASAFAPGGGLLSVRQAASSNNRRFRFVPSIEDRAISVLPLAPYSALTSTSTSTLLYSTDPDKDNQDENDKSSPPPSIMDRFLSPVIDDPALPLSDVLVAQIIAPSLQVVWLSLQHAPAPGWLRPVLDESQMFLQARGSLVAPALIHGAALASCWITGALAAKAYERPAIAPAADNTTGYATVVWRVVQAGAFASGLLILATQFDLLTEYGRWVQPGESQQIDLRLLTASVEVLNDIVFEAGTILIWRLFLARQTASKQE